MNRKIGNPAQVCSAVRSQVTDGRANGERLIHVANGRINFVLSESHALDVLQLWYEGTNVGFLAKGGLYAPPDDFPHKFPAGMVYTCGLDAVGAVEGHPPHGRIHSIPAEVLEIEAGEDGVRIVAEMRDARLFGSDLVVRRTVETDAGSAELRIRDEIVNNAFRVEPYCLLYHVNVGYPFVDVGARIEAKLAESRPRTEWAKKEMDKMLVVEPPVDNAEETCYFHRTADGVMSLVNDTLGLKLSVASNHRKFVEWKSRASGDYVIGLEPCSTWLDGEFRRSVLKPGAKAVSRLTLKIEEIKR